jgi:rhamnosyltransferase
MVDRSDIVCIDVLYDPDNQVVNNVQKYNGLVNRTILVDNSDVDNSKLFAELPNVVYIPLKRNTGIAYATNIGIKMTTEPYILTMDQDSSISEDLIKSYISFLKNNDSKNIGALTPKYETDRNHVITSNKSKEILLSMQSGTLIKRSTFQKIGLFNEDLFIDVVDWEFFIRMHEASLKLIQVGDAILKHKPAETKIKKIGPVNLKYGIASPARYYYQARNLLWVAKKHKNFSLYINFIIKWLKIVLLFNNKFEYLAAFNSGVKDAQNNILGRKK